MSARPRSLAPATCRHLDGKLLLLSPGVGLWRDAPAPGALLAPGGALGGLEVLGVVHPIFVPEGASGVVLPTPGPTLARRPVAYGELLATLDPELAAHGADPARASGAAATTTASSALRFCSPASGRVYLRPAPDKAPFVTPGELVRAGQTVCLLEVMKTFTRIHYGGAGLPEQARVLRVVPGDQDDLAAGDVILELEVGG